MQNITCGKSLVNPNIIKLNVNATDNAHITVFTMEILNLFLFCNKFDQV